MKNKLIIIMLAISMIAAGPAAQPTTRPVDPNLALVIAGLTELKKTIPSVGVLRNADQRAKLAPQAIPAIRKFLVMESRANAQKSRASSFYTAYDTLYRGVLITMGASSDVPGSPDAHPDISARTAEYILADRDRQSAIIASTQTKAAADASDDNTMQFCLEMHLAADAATPELDAKAKQIVTGMLAVRRAKIPDSKALTKAALDKPLTLEATLSDGKPFSTASWKGKVVLVDFWATWCGPCVAGLPHVKEIYKTYHSKGLEIVGVSNDSSGEALTKFLKNDPEMPWPQFFDAKAAAAGTWHPITQKYGVDTIPRMFLIDRQGVCRSITARQEMDTQIPKLLAEPVALSSSSANANPGLSAPTTEPTVVNSSKRTLAEINTDVLAARKTLSELLGKDKAPLKNAADRNAVAPKAIPVLNQIYAGLDELASVAPQYKLKVIPLQQQSLTLLSVLGDQSARDRIAAMVASKDSTEALQGQSDQLLARWYETEKTVPAQTAVIDDLEKLDRANPQSTALTQLTYDLSNDAASAELKQRMLTLTTDVMSNPTATMISKYLAARHAAAEKAAMLENKPLTIAGEMPDGKHFTSADLKGKVVLIDFWATWCGPCKAELPRVKKIYSDYHDKGLEIVGVSNDYDLDALKSFTAKEQMPWTELFDADAAANHQWNSATLSQGIEGIPTMYLIDRKGILRSATARENMEELIPKLLAEAN